MNAHTNKWDAQSCQQLLRHFHEFIIRLPLKQCYNTPIIVSQETERFLRNADTENTIIWKGQYE